MDTGAAAQQSPRWERAGNDRSTGTGPALDRDAAERVLRRAVELDEDPDVGRRISVQALLDAADELDIDRSEVRRAVVEEELGLLDERPRRSDALLGPDRVVVARVVDGSVDEVSARVDDWLRRGRILRRSRRSDPTPTSGAWVEYTRRTDPAAGAQRAIHTVRGRERLAHVRRVRVVVSDLGDRRCVVGLLVDASRSRTNAAAGGSLVAASGTAASFAGFHGVVGLFVAGTVASVGAGVGLMALRRTYTASVPEELESVLDAVQSGRRPPSLVDGVTDRLFRSDR